MDAEQLAEFFAEGLFRVVVLDSDGTYRMYGYESGRAADECAKLFGVEGYQVGGYFLRAPRAPG